MRSVTSSNLGASQQPEWNRHGYFIINDTLALQPEAKPVAGATKAEHRMSKAFKLCTRRIFARRKTG